METKKKHIGQLIVSIVVALALFFYATSSSYQNSVSTAKESETETYTNTVTNVPVNIAYNNKEYFISGFASNVTVVLNSSNRVILQKETDESTRSFEVTADLTEAQVGTQTVELQVSGLPTGISATVSPATLSVKIGKRASQNFTVVGKLSESQLAKGYKVSKINVALSTVKVTSDEETLAAIDRVEAVISSASNLSGNFSGTATLQAVDAEGNVLPVVFAKNQTTIEATIVKK